MARTFFVVRVFEFLFYRVLLSVVERVSRAPKYIEQSELERVYRENIALKTQIDALEVYISHLEPKRRTRKRPVVTRACQLLASLITRGNGAFKKDFLKASHATLRRWGRLLLGPRFAKSAGGRPPMTAELEEMIVTLKRDNRRWGSKRIQHELRRLGVTVSRPSIQKVLRAHGFSPHPGRKIDFTRVTTTVKDAMWALDYFAVRLAHGKLVQVLLIIDIATRSLMDLRAHVDWAVDSAFTVRTLMGAMRVSGRTPKAVVHDHGTHFAGQFPRALRVLEVDEILTPPQLPSMNCYAECAIGSVRREILRYMRPPNVDDLQGYLDMYRDHANHDRAHQGLAGRAPHEVTNDVAVADRLTRDEVSERRLVRRSSQARALLNAYALTRRDGPSSPTAKAA